jgi:hypothetical protein
LKMGSVKFTVMPTTSCWHLSTLSAPVRQVHNCPKRLANLDRRGLDFEDADLVFDGRPVMTAESAQ